METQSATNLNSKLLEFQKKINTIKKDGTNPHFGKSYATLPQILGEVKPVLSDLGLILLQPITDGKVETIIICSESGEKISSDMMLPPNINPQQIGSAITYYRRYLLAGMLSLEIEDDDANAAATASKQNQGSQSASTTDEPTEWLNIVDKDGTFTAKYYEIEKAIADGAKITLASIKKKYKVSKQTVEDLKHNLKIE